MPNLNINTKSADYKTSLAAIKAVRAMIGRRIRLFSMLDEDSKRRWVARDELMRELFGLVEDVRKIVASFK